MYDVAQHCTEALPWPADTLEEEVGGDILQQREELHIPETASEDGKMSPEGRLQIPCKSADMTAEALGWDPNDESYLNTP